jgi:hypothetical protein
MMMCEEMMAIGTDYQIQFWSKDKDRIVKLWAKKEWGDPDFRPGVSGTEIVIGGQEQIDAMRLAGIEIVAYWPNNP